MFIVGGAMESKYHGKTVALYKSGKSAKVADFEFKGHALQVHPPGHLPFTEVIEIKNGENKVCLGREAGDSYWTPLIKDPMTGTLCVSGRAPVFDLDVVS